MNLNTAYFGSVTYEKEEVIRFEEGLFGFEQERDFLPIPLEKDSDAVLCLQSMSDENLNFIIMNPFLLYPDYEPMLRKEDYKKLGTSKDEELSFYVICVMKENVDESTVNLKCPIAVNVSTRKACQVVLETNIYGFRHLLREFSRKEEQNAGITEKER